MLGVVGVVYASDLPALLGATPEMATNGRLFRAIMLGGSVTVTLRFLINDIFRGAGDPVLAMRALWLANLVNIVLDPILIIIFVLLPAWGVGNAAATLVGQNLGAGRSDRAERAVWFTARLNTLFLGLVGLVSAASVQLTSAVSVGSCRRLLPARQRVGEHGQERLVEKRDRVRDQQVDGEERGGKDEELPGPETVEERDHGRVAGRECMHYAYYVHVQQDDIAQGGSVRAAACGSLLPRRVVQRGRPPSALA